MEIHSENCKLQFKIKREILIMELIYHRRNSIESIIAADTKYGVEIDIRSHGDDLIIHHDPFSPGILLSKWLAHYNHGTLILNVKEEGLESRLIKLMLKKGLTNYFFLDQSFPFLIKWSKAGENRCAVRVSEYEPIETALVLSKEIDWVWIDCFSNFPLTLVEYKTLKSTGLKLCLVSPELQGRDPVTGIARMANYLIENHIVMDAVCTKRPDIWEKMHFTE